MMPRFHDIDSNTPVYAHRLVGGAMHAALLLALPMTLPSDIALSVDPLQSIMPARLYNDLQSYIFFPIPLREMLMLTRIQPAYIDAAKNLNGPGLDDRKFLVSVALS